MKKTILVLILLAGWKSQSQEKDRFNVGLHYRPPVGNTIDEFAGGADLRVRAVSLGVFNLGAGVSATYRNTAEESIGDYVIFNPHLYAEIQPFQFALKPYFSVGYLAYNQKIYLYRDFYIGPDVYDPVFSDAKEVKLKYSGFTLNAGARFDFAKFLYADVGLVYLNAQSDAPNSYYSFRNDGYGMINLGFGFRF